MIYTLLVGRREVERSCILFASIGAAILNAHLRIPARAVAGAFFLRFNDGGPPSEGIAFAARKDGVMRAAEDGFHMWVQTQHHIVDFMAPIFRETARGFKRDTQVPRRSFQRRLSEEAISLDAMARAGDFYTMPDLELTESLVNGLLERPSNGDLIRAALRWFKPYPQKLDDLTLADDAGELQRLEPHAPSITGVW